MVWGLSIAVHRPVVRGRHRVRRGEDLRVARLSEGRLVLYWWVEVDGSRGSDHRWGLVVNSDVDGLVHHIRLGN